MNKWNIIFCPDAGENYSPQDYILSLSDKKEAAIIMRRLDTIGSLNQKDWPPGWVKRIDDLYQLKAEPHRVYFGIYKKTLAVCHICRKVGQKARPQDLDRAANNFNQYLTQLKAPKK